MLPLALLACTAPPDDALLFFVPETLEPPMQSFARGLSWDDVRVEVARHPERRTGGGGLQVGLTLDLTCAQCFEVEQVGDDYVVHAGDLLGAQYGAAAVLEAAGFRFHHPMAALAPDSLDTVDPTVVDGLHEPDMQRRGLQLHTIHPIEALFDFYMPEHDGQDRAFQVLDWIVKNRGTHVQWISLDDLLINADHADWLAHTAPILEEAHMRGLTVSTGVQLFGAANFQKGYDLLDSVGTPEQQSDVIEQRMGRILRDELPWDMINLSFGEFVGASPQEFIDTAQRAVDGMKALSPGLEVGGKIHVGKDLMVEYQGEEMIFYFLAENVEGLVPWVHTVMYYNLFDDPGGSYFHDDYDEHREMLLRRLEAGEPVVYFPETAYWVAFDSPVPLYLPIYVHSRWRDQQGIREASSQPLQDQVLFSSGWEWGYWQNDVATLRMSYEHPDDWGDVYRDMFAPHPGGAALAEALIPYAETQYEHMIGQRMGAYLAGVDASMELGYSQGIVSQPRRTSFAEIAALDPAGLQAFADDDLVRLAALDADMRAHADTIGALGLDPADPWLQEVVDGVEITALRSTWVHQIYRAAWLAASGQDDTEALGAADTALAAARIVVDRRHAALWHPRADLLTGENDNPSIYQFGYLTRAEELCFWGRERIQHGRVFHGSALTVPGCAL